MKKTIYLLMLILSPAIAATQDGAVEAPGQLPDVREIVAECEGCHGLKGRSTRDDIASLANHSVREIEESMAQFYYYERHCPPNRPITPEGTGNLLDMCSVANTLSKQEVRAIAEYFATQ